MTRSCLRSMRKSSAQLGRAAVDGLHEAQAEPHGDDVDNDGLDEYLHRYLDEQSSEDEDEEEEIDVVGLDIPVLDVEEIGPLFLEDSSEEPEDALVPGSPSSSRSGCSTRRCREDSEEESAAKRPRWSEHSDED
ncbi:hypothetical protein KUCAC02_009138 [Chaenocephalus aceratus]|uniref:Uncharacterized protein n=1 Tax=Chaenocephalus aceratus TaxID=36190 RepID=A0ACB9WUD4_CHAAC|nr:hypothetical protein KUCAC02_009138 [Chaenocephalus aceratus]